jgi:hypothetical protein
MFLEDTFWCSGPTPCLENVVHHELEGGLEMERLRVGPNNKIVKYRESQLLE